VLAPPAGVGVDDAAPLLLVGPGFSASPAAAPPDDRPPADSPVPGVGPGFVDMPSDD
jgi:hypothetical protein